jgi:hypothetical protein
MFIGVILRCFICMTTRLGVVTVGYMSVMRRFFVVSGFMMFGSFLMMVGGMLMMLCGLFVLLGSFVLSHFDAPVGR